MSVQPPHAEDLTVGVPLPAAPDITIDEGMAAQYLAITGDQLRLALSAPLSIAVTGGATRVANPGLVIELSIGQSAVATRRVIANLRYRNLTLSRPVHIGETLRPVVTPLEASWTRSGTERAKVLLEVSLTTATGGEISRYQRLALLPVREPLRLVACEPAEPRGQVDLLDFAGSVPASWRHPATAHRPDSTPTAVLDWHPVLLLVGTP